MERFLSRNTLLVIVVAVGRQKVYIDFHLTNAVNQTMFARYLSTPSSNRFAFEWLGFSCAGFGMFFQFLNQFDSLLKGFRLIFK